VVEVDAARLVAVMDGVARRTPNGSPVCPVHEGDEVLAVGRLDGHWVIDLDGSPAFVAAELVEER
jgi:hypothetical protein